MTTWNALIERYLTDEFSPAQSVKHNTRLSYESLCQTWASIAGREKVASTDFVALKQIEQKLRRKGRSAGGIHKIFTMVRGLASYGKLIRFPGAKDVSETLSAMRFQNSPPRNAAPTREQIRAIIDEADARGMYGFACGFLIQWELALRAVDVFGQWFDVRFANGTFPLHTANNPLRINGKRNDSQKGVKRWQDGLTWDMVAPDFSSITKVISKTAKSLPDPITLSLEHLPEVRSRLRLLSNLRRIGPVIVSGPNGMPYATRIRDRKFRELRAAAGVPDTVWMMDARAGGLTEACAKGADLNQLRNLASHTTSMTTNRYLRDRSASASEAIRIRNA